MKRIFTVYAVCLLLIFPLFPSSAQEISWFTSRDWLKNDEFSDLIFLKGSNGSRLLMQMSSVNPPSVPQGQAYSESFLVGYDTSGVLQWTLSVPATGEFIKSDDEHLWYIVSGQDSLEVGGQFYYGSNKWPDFYNQYFFQLDADGNIVDYFTVGADADAGGVGFFSYCLDQQGNFLIGGSASPDGIIGQKVAFDLDSYSDTLVVGAAYLFYVARVDQSGKLLDIFTYEGPFDAKLRSAAPQVYFNPYDQLVYLNIAIGDSLTVAGQLITSPHPYKQPLVLRLDTSLNPVDHKVFDVSTYGGYFRHFLFHPNGKTYASGNWGDTFNLAPVIITGHPGTVNNIFIASLEGLDLEHYRTLRPVDHSRYFANMQFFVSAIDPAGDIHFGGYLWDSLFVLEDTILRFSSSSAQVERKSIYFTFDEELKLKRSLYPADDKSVGFYYGIDFDPYNGRVYLCGDFSGNYELGPVSDFSPAFDAFVMAISGSGILPSGIDELAESTIGLYPNPARDILYIQQEGNESLNLEIYGMDGRLVMQQAQIIQKKVNISRLEAGIYVVRLYTGEHLLTGKFVKR